MNKDKHSRMSREWYLQNKEHKLQMCKVWNLKNLRRRALYSSNRRALIAGLPGSYTLADVANLYEKQGGYCVYCGKDISAYYEVDHIIPVTRPEATNSLSNLQLLCQSCNRSKGNKTHEEYLEYLSLHKQAA